MGSKFVEVKLGKDAFTVEYLPARLLTAPVEVAKAAIAQEEAAFMSAAFSGQVTEDLTHLLLVEALYPKPLSEMFTSKRRCSARCTYVSDGVADWVFTLRCEECNGSGTTYTVSNKRVPCPDCDESGIASEVYFTTDLDGHFIGWGTDACHTGVANYGTGVDAIRLIAVAKDKALEMVAGWLS